MAHTAAPPEGPVPKRTSRLPLLIGLLLTLLGGAGGFAATYFGKMPGADAGEGGPASGLPDIAFVALEPITISLGPASRSRHLRFAAQIEVEARHAAEVEKLRPRILDMLNGYLRAVELAELEQTSSLVRLRAQMLRRLQIVTGEGRVRDLLITEFVMN